MGAVAPTVRKVDLTTGISYSGEEPRGKQDLKVLNKINKFVPINVFC